MSKRAVLGVATANAFLLYLDRVCMSAVVQSASFQKELQLSAAAVGDVLSVFFFAYAIGQLPAGWLADRFGPRKMLVVYVAAWSACTAATGLAYHIGLLLAVRVLCGLAEAGAYPTSALLLSRLFPVDQRARASSMVAFGGRAGGAVALWLTAAAIVAVGSWRPVLWLYGGAGMGLAWLSWRVFPEVRRESTGAFVFPWRQLLQHKSMWWLSLGLAGLNLAWAFQVTWLPTYLQKVHGLDAVSAGRYVSLALLGSLAGMLFGGWWCDWLTRRFGLVWGRRLPFVIGCAVGAAAYALCPWLPSGAWVAVMCGVVGFAADSVMPATWALCQDMGNEHVASTMAWGNMWGNFGAALVAKVIPLLLASSVHRAGWDEVFWMCAGGLVLLGGCALQVDAREQVRVGDTSTR
jgi:ACS family glucarate transporter-like MFS transporter